MKTRSIVLLWAAFSICLSASAHARPEAIVYDLGDFQGRSVTLRYDTPNFEFIGFNDKAASIYIIDGVWEFCTDGYYQGNCRRYSPGEYRQIGAQNDRISSARVVGAGGPSPGGGYPPPGNRPPPPGDWNPVGRGEIALYDRQDFQGRSITLNGATPDFERMRFNDAAASIIVRRGTWQLCKDADFRGDCRTYGPGEYRRLPNGHDDAYSSARTVEGWGGGGPNRPGPGGRAPRIGLFEYPDFSGRSMWLDRSSGDFENIGFNDRAESLIVEDGQWTVCADARLRGSCRTFGPGRYPSLPLDLRNKVSSARLD